jgi:hypothetical protein
MLLIHIEVGENLLLSHTIPLSMISIRNIDSSSKNMYRLSESVKH